MTYRYTPHGVCSRKFTITITDDIIQQVTIQGGCNGNLKGLSALVKHRKVKEIIPLLEGITCDSRSTSCPDQLAIALKQGMQVPA